MVNNRRRILVLKYAFIALLFFVLYVLQTTPRFLEIRGVRPVLLIPAAVAFAMFEGGFTGGLYGALAGMLCDLMSFSFYGLYSILLMGCCMMCGLLTVHLMRRTLWAAYLLVAGSCLLCGLLRFYFDYALWGYDGISTVFITQSLPTMLYTAFVTPLFYGLFMRLESYFENKIGL